jgi:hypothetical protein
MNLRIFFVIAEYANKVFGVVAQNETLLFSKQVHDRYDFADGIKAVRSVEFEESIIYQSFCKKYPDLASQLVDKHPEITRTKQQTNQ